MTVHVTRLPIRLLPDPSRVITRFFAPGEENRIRDIIERLLAIPEAKVEILLASLGSNFRPMHPDIDDVFLEHFEMVKHHISSAGEVSDGLRLLIGACFTMEYAIESTALFNPSMVPAIDQAGLPSGSVRFVMSLRATGEGHISSIVFRQASSMPMAGSALTRPADTAGRWRRSFRTILKRITSSVNCTRSARGPTIPRKRWPSLATGSHGHNSPTPSTRFGPRRQSRASRRNRTMPCSR